MKAFENICIIFLLIILTLCIVFIPPVLSGQREESVVNKIINLDFSVGSRPKLTSEHIARLYRNLEIGVGFNSAYISDESVDTEKIREDISELIDMLFEENRAIKDFVKNLFSESELNYYRNSSLIKINNQPTAINFVSCGTKNEKGYIEIDYEEKTKTIVQFSCYGFDEMLADFKDAGLYLNDTSPMDNSYYENQLNLSDEEYYFILSIVPVDADSEDNRIARFFIDCGINRQGDKVKEEAETEIIYN